MLFANSKTVKQYFDPAIFFKKTSLRGGCKGV